MGWISTDDGARRLRYIWLGPPGFRFPFDARFPAFGLAAAIIAVGAILSWAILPTYWLPTLGTLASVGFAVPITRKVMRRVDHDRPLRYHARTLRAEVATPRPDDDTPVTYELAVPRDLFTDHDARTT